ncbi:MAG: glycosyltransferase family 4 protein [Cycloclasticus sp.]
MKHKRHLLVLDPIAFFGGSKLATENILRQLDGGNIQVTLLTVDRQSWSWRQLRCRSLFEVPFLARQTHGIPYFIRHVLIAIQLIITRYKTTPFDVALGASGPGVDFALYLAKPFLGYQIIQLVHGNVACSRTIGRCLLLADEIHYLESTKESLLSALRKFSRGRSISPTHLRVMQNGLLDSAWPSRCQMVRPVILWAASLMPWKRIDLFIDALSLLDEAERCETHICFIRPKNTPPAHYQPFASDTLHWHESPNNIDSLRAQANIFVSTSHQEPFGLSILEAMAAGHCVLIPTDGAYWDRQLVNGLNCIKYPANDACALSRTVAALTKNMPLVRSLGLAAAKKAQQYQAANCYAPLKNSLLGISHITPPKSAIDQELAR